MARVIGMATFSVLCLWRPEWILSLVRWGGAHISQLTASLWGSDWVMRATIAYFEACQQLAKLLFAGLFQP